MPEISDRKRKTNRGKGGCSACSCCLFPRKKVKEEHSEREHESVVQASTLALLEKKVHTEHLPEPLKCGSCITINASVLPECTRFAVNLLCGKTEDSDIAMHINPRISQRYVNRNSRISGKWGDEETTSVAKFELARNSKFLIDVVVTENEFMVSINGKHVYGFPFRLPVSKVTTLMVEGAVEVEDIKYHAVEVYPPMGPHNAPYKIPTGDGKDKKPDQQLNISSSDIYSGEDDVPLTAALPQGFKKDWQLEINGRVKILPSAFYINLQEGSQLWPHPVIPLHLNPRFTKSSFVRNAWIGGKWGKEECCPTFPFYPGDNFYMAIRKNEDNFSVWVNGQLIGEFLFRGDVDKINTVYVYGDVFVKSLYMKEHIDDKYFSQSQENLKPLSL